MSRRTKRGWIAAAALAAGTLVLSACAGGAAPNNGGTESGDTGKITFRSWSPIQQTTQQMVTAFQDANPGTTIDSTIFNYPEYLVDLQTRASSNTMPDIIGLQPGALTQQYRNNLLPLNECAEKTWGANWKDKFYPIGLEQAQLGNPKGDDNYYALPILVQTVNMWANTNLFSSAGQQIPKTWDELANTVKAMKGGSYTPFLLPAKDSWVRNVVFLQIANNVDPGYVYKAEDGSAKWTDSQIVKAFDYWQKLFTDGIAQSGALSLDSYPSGANQFEAGKAAMIPLGAWWIQQSDPTKDQSTIPDLSKGMSGYQPFLFPTVPGGAAESQYVGGTDVALGISKNTKNPTLACKVLTDWIAGEGAQKLVNTMNDIPAVQGVTPEKFTSDKQKQIWDMFVNDWLPKVKYSRYFESPKIDTAVGDALSAVATGSQTPEQAAAAVQKVQDQVLAAG
ncbi:hypothetical protein [Microbacterium sp. KR10-403]|uniref:ABC transporter substrate-binding protein n=1 Tax=Microbacterium sp. KR10-403 TaxID=3158581 RepID=UPI0032E4B414